MTGMEEKELNEKVARQRAIRSHAKEQFKARGEFFPDELLDKLTEDEQWRKEMKAWIKKELYLREVGILEEVAEEHQSKTEASMRKRHVPEYMIP